TDGAGRVSYLNRVAEELTGWEGDHAAGEACTKVLQMFYQRDGKPVEDFVPVAMLQGEAIPLPPNICLKDRQDRTRSVEGSIGPKRRNGRVDGAVIVFRDVTLGEFQEEHLKQDEKQEALVRMADGIAQRLDVELGTMTEESTRLLESLPVDSLL